MNNEITVLSRPAPVRFEHWVEGNFHKETGDFTKGGLGIGSPTPRLSWCLTSAPSGFKQTAYEIQVIRKGESARYLVESSEQVLVPWPAEPLHSRGAATAAVRVTDGSQWSDWSEPSLVETGLLNTADWSAEMIAPTCLGGLDQAAPILSKSFTLKDKPQSARLYATAHGIYVVHINGQRVGDQQFAPGWTSYHHRLRYHTYDVAELLQAGENKIEVTLGNGWYRGYLGYEGLRAIYGEQLALLAQLEVFFADGSEQLVVTDASWQSRASHILMDDFYNGQTTDLRLLTNETTKQGGGVTVIDGGLDRLVAPEGPPVRATETLSAKKIWTSPAGKTLVDFGQNLVGWVRLKVRDLASGSEVILRHAEVLEHDELGVRPLRSAKATDTYFVAGSGEEVLEPTFTFHGFRYAEVSGVDDLPLQDIEAVVLGSDLQRTGWFECSDPLLNQFHDNIVWGMRGNFLDVPTDCPQRNERLGWTGDIQVFGPTASYLFNVAGFLSSWLQDLAAEQREDGAVPHYVPCVSDKPFAVMPTAAWGDVTTLLPWVLYQRFADRELLQRQWPSMCAWFERVKTIAGENLLWTGGFQFGDWLDPAAPPEEPGRAAADSDVVATAHFARSADVMAQAALVLGKESEAAEYREQFLAIRQAFNDAYVTPAGRILSDAQTVYALAIEWQLLLSEKQRLAAGDRLADLVRTSGFRISTGFIGTPMVCDALTTTGHVDVAYRLLLQTDCPSWLYPVTVGATTVWERWDSMLADGSINPGEMTSFNHYALGAVADWMHRRVAGLAPLSPGYRQIEIKPAVGCRLQRAAAKHLTAYGEVSANWQRNNGDITICTEVPVGVTAVVTLPGNSETFSVEHGSYSWTVPDPFGRLDKPLVTVRDLLDSEPLWQQVVAAAIDNGVAQDQGDVARRMERYLDAPIAMTGHALGPDLYFPGTREMRQQIAELLGVDDTVVGVSHQLKDGE